MYADSYEDINLGGGNKSRLGWVPWSKGDDCSDLPWYINVSLKELHSICAPNLLPTRALASVLPGAAATST